MQSLLIADDDPGIRRVIVRIISTVFPEAIIKEAADGDEALDLLADDVVCVLADISMPRRDGIRMCWSIRHAAPFAAWKDVPVILMSALHLDERILALAWQAGTALVIPKPFEVGHVADLIVTSAGLRPHRGAVENDPRPQIFAPRLLAERHTR